MTGIGIAAINNVKKSNIYIGTSGWHYKHWVGTFYPKNIKARDQFDYYQQHFDSVELNNSFYRLPTPETFMAWRKQSNDNFLFIVKASRYITHQKKLKDPKVSVKRFFENVKYLKSKLGPILFQLPPSWKINLPRFQSFLKVLPRKFRYVFEFRNTTWYAQEVFDLLEKYNCAFCIYELAGHHAPVKITADFVYVRLHGPGEEKYQGSYTRPQLKRWAECCRQWQQKKLDVFVYFDNDQRAYAAHNALTLRELLLQQK